MFCAGGKQRANFLSLDCCSFNVSLWFFSSACILMMPGVIISPGLLLDVDVEMLETVLK